MGAPGTSMMVALAVVGLLVGALGDVEAVRVAQRRLRDTSSSP